MKKGRIVTLAGIALLALLFLSGCGNPTEQSMIASNNMPNDERDTRGEMTSGIERMGNKSYSEEEQILAIIRAEEDGLKMELEKEKATDPIMIGKAPEGFTVYESWWNELEEVLKAQVEEPENNLWKEKELELRDKEATIDPKGVFSQYMYEKLRAEEKYGTYSYFFHEESPFQSGIDFNREDSFADPLQLLGSSLWPYGVVSFSRFDAACTGSIVSKEQTVIDLRETMSEEEYKKWIQDGGKETEVEVYYQFRISTCYLGGYETGDTIAFIPRLISEELLNKMEKGGEWMLFLWKDKKEYTIKDSLYQGYSSVSSMIYEVKENRVKSTSYNCDMNQYDGLTPRDLVLTVLRIRAKYTPDHTPYSSRKQA